MRMMVGRARGGVRALLTDAIYDLYATDLMSRGLIPWDITWPIAPTISQTFQVSNQAELDAALAVPQSRIQVGANNYTSLDITNDDIWVDCDSEARFASMSIGRLNGSSLPSRIIVEGGRLDQQNSELFTTITSDMLIRNMEMKYRSWTIGGGTGIYRFDRVALIKNTMFAYKGALLTNNSREAAGGAIPHNADLIIAGNNFAGGMDPADAATGENIEFGLRLMGNDRLVVVDNRGRNGYTGYAWKNAYRIQDGNQNVWFRRNMTEYGDAIRIAGVDTVPQYQGAMWIYDHIAYIPNEGQSGLLGLFALRQGVNASTYFEPLTVDGNIGYDFRRVGSPVDPGRWSWSAQSGDVIGTNLEYPYEEPPLLSAWLAADGLPPGTQFADAFPTSPF